MCSKEYTMCIQGSFRLLCLGVQLKGGEDVQEPPLINCDKGFEVRREVNTTFPSKLVLHMILLQ